MTLKSKAKITFISISLILTFLLSWLVGSITDREMRTDFTEETQICANCVDITHLKNLTGTLADLKSPDYLQIKQQLASIRKVDKNLYFAYIMGVKKNGKVFFYVDDRPDGHPEGSPPGSPYDEAPKEFNRVMQTGIPTVEGPSADSWGSYASGCAPIVDPKTGKVIAIFAIDYITRSWYWTLISRVALPVGLIIALVSGIFLLLVSKRRGKLIKSSEEKYRFMFHNNPQPNWIYDLETLAFREVNQTAITVFGYSKEEFLSMTLKDICIPEDIPLLSENILRISNSYNKSGEWRHVKKNGELIHVEIISHSVLFNGRESRHVLVHDITERKQTELALENSKEQLRKFASHLQSVREEEKVALAREIHDDLGQIFVALKIDMGLLKQKVMKTTAIADSMEILPEFDNIINLIDYTIKTARRIMNGLRPELLEIHGFEGATKEYLRKFEKRHAIICEFTCEIPYLRLDPQQSLSLFRILQETMNNIVKHANATQVDIHLKNRENKLCLEIRDDGIGFDKNESGREDSYGLIGMQERVVLLEGKLNITSKVGLGTTISIEMPYSSQTEMHPSQSRVPN
jgi:PAS domain S-box-containing protein